MPTDPAFQVLAPHYVDDADVGTLESVEDPKAGLTKAVERWRHPDELLPVMTIGQRLRLEAEDRSRESFAFGA